MAAVEVYYMREEQKENKSNFGVGDRNSTHISLAEDAKTDLHQVHTPYIGGPPIVPPGRSKTSGLYGHPQSHACYRHRHTCKSFFKLERS